MSDRMKRLLSVLFTICMLAVMLPVPALTEADAPVLMQVAQSALAGEPQPEPETETKPANTSTADSTDEATGTPAPAPTDETAGTPAPVPTDEATGTPAPVPTDETAGTPAPVPTDEATGTPTPVPTDEATGTPAPGPTDEASGTPAPVPTDEAAGTPTPVPTDAAEVKTIASFEDVAPEGFAVPQGTPETGLGLPASLNVQFADGAAGEVAGAWQCAAGYDPNAEAGAQFAFVAVLPQGYALAEGVSLPQILVTLTPPLANAMLMADGIVDSGDGWMLSEDGKLTVTGDVESGDIPPAIWNAVTNIEIAANASFYLDSNFSGDIHIADVGSLNIDGTISGGTITAEGPLNLLFRGGITGSANVQILGDAILANNGTISGGTFTGEVRNLGSISGGDFTGATVENNGGTVTGGVFDGFKLENSVLTITGTVDLNNPDALDPLTIGLDAVIKIIINSGASFNAGSNAVSASVINNGTITGGTFKGDVNNNIATGVIRSGSFIGTVHNNGAIEDGTFNGDVNNGGTINGGDFTGATVENNDGTVTGGVFDGFTMDSQTKELTITGHADLSATDSFASQIIIDNWNNVSKIVVASDASFNAGDNAVDDPVTNNGTITGGSFGRQVTNEATGVIQTGTFDNLVTNKGAIAGGTFNAIVEQNEAGASTAGGAFNGPFTLKNGTISGGDFKAVQSSGGEITGGTFPDFEVKEGCLTVTGFADLQNCAFPTLTQITIEAGGHLAGFDGSKSPELTQVTCNGTISGGTFTGATVTNNSSGTIEGGTFTDGTTVKNSGGITGGDFKGATVTNEEDGTVSGGEFDNFKLESGELTITGTVDLNADEDALAPLTIALTDDSIQSVTVAEGATFNAEGNTVDGPVTCNGKITGGTFTRAITGAGELAGGDFSGADLSGFNGTITGGTFDGYTIRVEEPTGRILTITAEDFDLTGISLAGVAVVEVAKEASVANANVQSNELELGLINYGTIKNGIFAAEVLENVGTINDGKFDCIVTNESGATISGGEFNNYLANKSTITGATINGDIYNYEGGTIKGCTFGAIAEVIDNTGTIEVTMTVNGADATFKYDENILSALNAKFGEGDWHAVVGEEQAEISEDARFGLQKQAYACAHYTKDNTLYISAPTNVTEEMLAGVTTVEVKAGGEILSGIFTDLEAMTVHEGGKISGGTFERDVVNNGDITEGAFGGIVGNNGTISGGTFERDVYNYEGGTITGGVFDGFTMDSQSKELTITGAVDLDAEDALAPLTIALDGENLRSITVAEGATFDAGSTTVPVDVTNNGTITNGTFSGDVENSGTISGEIMIAADGYLNNDAGGTISGEITIAEYGSLNNDAGGTISDEITIAAYGNLNNNAGGTISGGTFTVFDYGRMANWGTITGSATFEISELAALTNDGTISGGSFTGDVTNHDDGKITGGTFNSGSLVGNSGIISGGTFSGAEVLNTASTSGTITGGTFGNGTVVTNRGAITDGDFRGATVNNDDDGTVTGGTFDKFTVATDEDGGRTITITGDIGMDSEDALHPLTIGLDAVKSINIAAGGSFDAGNTPVSVPVDNYGEIGGGTFDANRVRNYTGGVISAGTFGATVYNYGGKIAGGTFNATVNNAEGGEISGGTFGSGVYNMSSITGAITLTSEQSLINFGGDISGDITFTKEADLNNDGGTISGDITFTQGGRLDNSGEITGGAISGAAVVNRSEGIIFDGTFTDATVDNDGIIAYGDFRAAEVTNGDGSITGGIFKNCTLKDGKLTITQNVDLREDADALAPLSLAADPCAKLEIASGCAFNAGDNTVTVHVTNHGTISGGTFNNRDVFNNPGGTISGGAFSGRTSNEGAITGGTFGYLYQNARVQGVDGSVPTFNGPIENGMGSILQPCNFGANASVVENRGVIEVPATINGLAQSLATAKRRWNSSRKSTQMTSGLSRRRTGRRRAWPKAPPSASKAAPMSPKTCRGFPPPPRRSTLTARR